MGHGVRNVLLVGSGISGEMLENKIKNHPELGYSIVKVINGATGEVLYQNSFPGNYVYTNTFDIDGDGYIELLLYIQYESAPYNSKLTILSTASHVIAVENDSKTAAKYNLGQNYPNPFNPTTTISYSISKEANVKLILYTELGEQVGTYINEKQTAGEHKFIYDGNKLASGVYFYQLVVDNQPETKKMVLVK